MAPADQHRTALVPRARLRARTGKHCPQAGRLHAGREGCALRPALPRGGAAGGRACSRFQPALLGTRAAQVLPGGRMMQAAKALIQRLLALLGLRLVRVGGPTDRPRMENGLRALATRRHAVKTVIDIGASNGSWS